MWKSSSQTDGPNRFFGFCCGIAVLLVSATVCIAIIADVARREIKCERNAPAETESPSSWREPTSEEFSEICRQVMAQPRSQSVLSEALERGLRCRCEIRPGLGAGIACYQPPKETSI